MSPSTHVDGLTWLEVELIELYCRERPCEAQRNLLNEARRRGRTDTDALFYRVCLEVCEASHFCPLRYGRPCARLPGSLLN